MTLKIVKKNGGIYRFMYVDTFEVKDGTLKIVRGKLGLEEIPMSEIKEFGEDGDKMYGVSLAARGWHKGKKDV